MRTANDRTIEASRDMDSIRKTFKYDKVGISPEMAKAVNAHVKKYGIAQVWNNFGSENYFDPYPEWFDTTTNRVRKLKLKWVVAV
jgi:hypothetical protein